MKSENRHSKLAPLHVFYRRLFNSISFAMCVLGICLAIGIMGYHFIAGIAWIDSLHNASMILSGMGPVVEIKGVPGKLFSSAYALFSGVVFITNIGILLAPVAHRLLHLLHIDDNGNAL